MGVEGKQFDEALVERLGKTYVRVGREDLYKREHPETYAQGYRPWESPSYTISDAEWQSVYAGIRAVLTALSETHMIVPRFADPILVPSLEYKNLVAYVEQHIAAEYGACSLPEWHNPKDLAAIERLIAHLEHIQEYWNGSRTEGAMSNALDEILHTCEVALKEATYHVRS